MLGADEVPEAKPGGGGLLKCCELLRALPEASVYVGDAPTDGMAARAAGMASIGVTCAQVGERDGRQTGRA